MKVCVVGIGKLGYAIANALLNGGNMGFGGGLEGPGGCWHGVSPYNALVRARFCLDDCLAAMMRGSWSRRKARRNVRWFKARYRASSKSGL